MATPEQRRAAALIAVHTSWARTADRQARTREATRNSPVSVDYWIARVQAEGIVAERDVPAAAENYRQAYMRKLAAKSAASRARNRAARQAAARSA